MKDEFRRFKIAVIRRQLRVRSCFGADISLCDVGLLCADYCLQKSKNRSAQKISRKLIFWTFLRLRSFSKPLGRSVVDFVAKSLFGVTNENFNNSR